MRPCNWAILLVLCIGIWLPLIQHTGSPLDATTEYLIAHGNNLPNISVIVTGGTICGAAESPTNTTHYRAGALHFDDVIRELRKPLSKFANVVPYQIMSIDSVDMGSSHMIAISRMITEQVQRPNVTAVVVIGGTSAISELAFCLGVTVKSNKPIVLTGALMPHTAYNADGPGNIIDAVRLAATPGWSEEYHEVATVMNGSIALPWGTRKEGNQLKPGFGSWIGNINSSGIYFKDLPGRYAPTKFNISGLSPTDPLPEVVIITVCSGFEAELVRMAIVEGTQGIVLLVYDDGYIPQKAGREIEVLLEQYDIVIVAASYSPPGIVVHERIAGVIPGGDWDPRQLRILLQFHILEESDRKDIAESITRGPKATTDKNMGV